VAIQLGGDPKISSGKDFTPTDRLVSIISRKSIDVLKELYRDEVNKDEWNLIIELKPFFKIG
jgi:translation initiation factor 5B